MAQSHTRTRIEKVTTERKIHPPGEIKCFKPNCPHSHLPVETTSTTFHFYTETYETSPTHLTSMPTQFWELPYAFPKNDPDEKKINNLLEYSLRQQKEWEISDNSPFVSYTVHMCFDAMNIKNTVVNGYRIMFNSYRPHVWLIIKNQPVDNCWNKSFCVNAIKDLEKNYPCCYKENLEGVDEDGVPYLDNNEESPNVVMERRAHYFRYKPDRAMALCINRQQAYNYFFSMIRYVHAVSGDFVIGLGPECRHECWHCGKVPRGGVDFISDVADVSEDNLTGPEAGGSNPSWKFSHCGRCMVAIYCSKNCQWQDWKNIHSYMCLSREHHTLPTLGDYR